MLAIYDVHSKHNKSEDSLKANLMKPESYGESVVGMYYPKLEFTRRAPTVVFRQRHLKD